MDTNKNRFDEDKFQGLYYAAFTPFTSRGDVNFDLIKIYSEYLVDAGASGIYICGSSGEGPSLTSNERKRICETFKESAGGNFRIIVNISHNSIKDAN